MEETGESAPKKRKLSDGSAFDQFSHKFGLRVSEEFVMWRSECWPKVTHGFLDEITLCIVSEVPLQKISISFNITGSEKGKLY